MRKQDKLKKMNKLSAKAINALRQKVTKFNKDEFANDIDQFRAVSCATTLLACTAYSMRFCCRPACGMFLMKGGFAYLLLAGWFLGLTHVALYGCRAPCCLRAHLRASRLPRARRAPQRTRHPRPTRCAPRPLPRRRRSRLHPIARYIRLNIIQTAGSCLLSRRRALACLSRRVLRKHDAHARLSLTCICLRMYITEWVWVVRRRGQRRFSVVGERRQHRRGGVCVPEARRC